MFRRVAAVVTVALAALLLPSPASAAGSALVFRKAYVNSPGPDTRTNASLNAEYIVIRNIGARSRNLRGWTVRDKAGHVYAFTSDFILKPDTYVKLHTGKGTNSASHRYWGSGNYIWNNKGDTAYLRRPSGTNADVCSWGKVASYIRC
ncbi:MAG: lamin tail domain-containing protein [Hamadaea sp.]|nr:lamin tail domain-containing protein [Hamadaea sp.]